MLVFAGFMGCNAENNFHWKVITSGEGLTAGTINHGLICMARYEELVKLQVGVTFFCLEKVGI
eukprot:3523878-Ditylum_brightwellii.AAC.1